MKPSPFMTQYHKFKCIYCGQSIECDRKHIGRQTKCPTCNHNMVIPPEAGGDLAGSIKAVREKWDTQIPTPDVSTPTRYQAGAKPKSRAGS